MMYFYTEKFTLSLLLVLGYFFSAYAQEKREYTQHKTDSIFYRVDGLPSKLHSIHQVDTLRDSLLPSFQKLDSIRIDFNKEALAMQGEYTRSVNAIESQTKKLNHKIDSLGKLNIPTDKHFGRVDSLNQLRQKKMAEFNSKVESVKAKTTGRLNSLDLPPQYNEPVQQITSKVDGFGLNSDFVKIPQLEIPGYKLPKLDGISDLSTIGDLNIGDVGNLAKELNLPKVESQLGDLGQITDQLKNVQGDIKSVASGNLSEVKELPKSIEQHATKIDGVSELQKQSQVIDEIKGKLEIVKDPQQGKGQAAEKVKEAAIDHFAGKEEQLKKAMDQMAKYKQKYSSVSSLKDLPKRAPNAMKGKPFIERLLPGFYFQFQQKRYNLFDFNPYVAYHISGRFTAGLGWNQRFAWDKNTTDWNNTARIFGPRVFVDFKLGKGFIAHLEGETMNTFVPSTILGTPDTGHREWVWGMMTGMKKQYKIFKNLRGTVVLQYNIFNPKFKAPYVDRINSRIGFEYVLRKKTAKQE
jgi:hypothetical protein